MYYNVTFRGVLATIVGVESNKYYIFCVCVCMCVCVCVCSLWYPARNVLVILSYAACMAWLYNIFSH